MPNVNPDLDALHGALVRIHGVLYERLGQATDPKVAQAILTEMQEVTHRLDLVQILLFTRATAAITAAVSNVQSATAGLNAALNSIQTAANVVQGCTTFLGIIDEALDLAKLAAA